MHAPEDRDRVSRLVQWRRPAVALWLAGWLAGEERVSGLLATRP